MKPLTRWDFSELPPTTQRIILRTASHLPWGRFLASVSPSACQRALNPEITMGRCCYEAFIFSEKVSKLCRDDRQARQYLSSIVPALPCCTFLDPSGSRKLAEELYSVAEEEGYNVGDTYYTADKESLGKYEINLPVLRIEFGATDDDSECGYLLCHSSKPTTVLEESLLIATFLGAMKDWAGMESTQYSSTYDTYGKEIKITYKLPLSVPLKPNFPSEWDTLREKGRLSRSEFKERRMNFYSSWREDVGKIIKEALCSRGLGFIFESA